MMTSFLAPVIGRGRVDYKARAVSVLEGIRLHFHGVMFDQT